MGDEANSWIRRSKFSHTVCHRLDSSKLASFNSFDFQLERTPQLKSRPEKSSSSSGHQKSESVNNVRIQRNPAKTLQRSASPLPQTLLPDTFKEAQSDKKRFLSPHPRRRREPEKGIAPELFDKDAEAIRSSKSSSKPFSNSRILKQFLNVRAYDKAKNWKESSWTKYFDYGGGGRVTAVEAIDDYVVDRSKLLIGLRFAHGAHSRLYHGLYKDKPVAVKIIRIPDDDENGDLGFQLEKQFNREVTHLCHLHHPNVIRFVAACREPPVFCIITEYLPGGSLRAYLHKLERKSLPLEKLVRIALDIAHGMEYIHSQGVIHRDLKPENVLISEDFHVKIMDFGIACEEAYCDSLTDDPGTFRWMAPEMIKRKSYGRRVDVYGFGLILCEMMTGTIPYEDMTPMQAAFAVVNKNLRPVIPDSCPPAMRALIERCWSSHPEKRPEFWQVVKVLEQFESCLALEGTLNLAQGSARQDRKKGGPLRWIQKLGPAQSSGSFISKHKP